MMADLDMAASYHIISLPIINVSPFSFSSRKKKYSSTLKKIYFWILEREKKSVRSKI
jgi:hypothetical protein